MADQANPPTVRDMDLVGSSTDASAILTRPPRKKSITIAEPAREGHLTSGKEFEQSRTSQEGAISTRPNPSSHRWSASTDSLEYSSDYSEENERGTTRKHRENTGTSGGVDTTEYGSGWTAAMEERLTYVQAELKESQKRWSAGQELWLEEAEKLQELRRKHKKVAKKKRQLEKNQRSTTEPSKRLIPGGKGKRPIAPWKRRTWSSNKAGPNSAPVSPNEVSGSSYFSLDKSVTQYDKDPVRDDNDIDADSHFMTRVTTQDGFPHGSTDTPPSPAPISAPKGRKNSMQIPLRLFNLRRLSLSDRRSANKEASHPASPESPVSPVEGNEKGENTTAR